MHVSVFGGSAPLPNTPAYQQAYHLGQLLGKAKHTVLTGGYIGTMEAVSKGAAEMGGHVIGVTCDEIEAWRPVAPNQWVQTEHRYKTLWERLYHLVKECDAAMALPGGTGTLAEITLMWNQMQVNALPIRPLILIGEGWKSAMDAFLSGQKDYIADKDWKMVSFAQTIEDAVQYLNAHTV